MRAGTFLGGHVDHSAAKASRNQYMIVCACRDCAQQAPGGRVFSASEFASHGGRGDSKKWRFSVFAAEPGHEAMRLGRWLHAKATGMLRLGLAPGSRLRVWRPPPALQAGEGAWLVGEVVATCTQVKERGKDPQLYHTVRFVGGAQKRLILPAERVQVPTAAAAAAAAAGERAQDGARTPAAAAPPSAPRSAAAPVARAATPQIPASGSGSAGGGPAAAAAAAAAPTEGALPGPHPLPPPQLDLHAFFPVVRPTNSSPGGGGGGLGRKRGAGGDGVGIGVGIGVGVGGLQLPAQRPSRQEHAGVGAEEAERVVRRRRLDGAFDPGEGHLPRGRGLLPAGGGGAQQGGSRRGGAGGGPQGAPSLERTAAQSLGQQQDDDDEEDAGGDDNGCSLGAASRSWAQAAAPAGVVCGGGGGGGGGGPPTLRHAVLVLRDSVAGVEAELAAMKERAERAEAGAGAERARRAAAEAAAGEARARAAALEEEVRRLRGGG